MARNRKRAKERRDRRPQPVAGRSRVAAGQGDSSLGMPSPLEHAAPEVELADAQLAVGRAENGPDGAALSAEEAYEDDFDSAEELSAGPLADGAGDGAGSGGGAGSGHGTGSGDGAGSGGGPGGGALSLPAPGAVPEARARPGSRLIGFLEGSWRELQRVQWPDRRQVMQATAVVLGFVIVAGVFLGVADTAASHLMNYILTGK